MPGWAAAAQPRLPPAWSDSLMPARAWGVYHHRMSHVGQPSLPPPLPRVRPPPPFSAPFSDSKHLQVPPHHAAGRRGPGQWQLSSRCMIFQSQLVYNTEKTYRLLSMMVLDALGNIGHGSDTDNRTDSESWILHLTRDLR